MEPEAVLRLFESVGAVRHGHFELTSGLHSEAYVQCALILQYPKYAEQLGQALAAFFLDLRIGCVASPALGGVLVGHEVARALPPHSDGTPVPAIFVERDAKGTLTLRRGFQVAPEERILVVEDVWTTGGSTRETMRVVEQAGGRVVAAGALMDRSGGRLDLPGPARALATLKVENYSPAECPLCRAGSVAVKPGSHFVRANA
jgi:orotate phosphoribosyltransferase